MKTAQNLIAMTLVAVILIGVISSISADENDYCRGLCQARYESGFNCGEKCCCFDQVIKESKRLTIPKRAKKEFEEPKIFYGYDEMHIPVPERESPPTAPMDF